MLKKIIILSLAVSQANISASDDKRFATTSASDRTPDKYNNPEFKAFLEAIPFEKIHSLAFKEWFYDTIPRGKRYSQTMIWKFSMQYQEETGLLPYILPESTPRK